MSAITDFWASIQDKIFGIVAYFDGGEDSRGANFVKKFGDFLAIFFGAAEKAAE